MIEINLQYIKDFEIGDSPQSSYQIGIGQFFFLSLECANFAKMF